MRFIAKIVPSSHSFHEFFKAVIKCDHITFFSLLRQSILYLLFACDSQAQDAKQPNANSHRTTYLDKLFAVAIQPRQELLKLSVFVQRSRHGIEFGIFDVRFDYETISLLDILHRNR